MSHNLTEEQIQAASVAEQNELDESQKTHLRNRVVLLRAQLDASRNENAILKETINTLREGHEAAEL